MTIAVDLGRKAIKPTNQPMGQSYYPRTPQDTKDTLGHIKTLKDTFIRLFLLCFKIKSGLFSLYVS